MLDLDHNKSDATLFLSVSSVSCFRLPLSPLWNLAPAGTLSPYERETSMKKAYSHGHLLRKGILVILPDGIIVHHTC